MSNLIYQKFILLYLVGFLNCDLNLQQKDFCIRCELGCYSVIKSNSQEVSENVFTGFTFHLLPLALVFLLGAS